MTFLKVLEITKPRQHTGTFGLRGGNFSIALISKPLKYNLQLESLVGR